MNALRRNNLVIVWLALAGALALRSLVPTGWMPIVDNGAIRIMLCDGAGPVELSPPASDQQVHGSHTQHGGEHEGGHHDNAPHDVCPFGLALGNAFDLPAPPSILEPPNLSANIEVPALIAAGVVARRNLKPPATGPPILA